MKKITYKEIYKVLDVNGVIDNLVNKYSEMENTQLVKADIIYAIELAVNFFESPSFKEMKYWFIDTEEIKIMIAKEIYKEFAEIKSAEMKEEIKQFDHVIKLLSK